MGADDRAIVTFGMKIPAGIFIPSTMVCPSLRVVDVGRRRAFRTNISGLIAQYLYFTFPESFQFLCDG